jgi:hypothetical protein
MKRTTWAFVIILLLVMFYWLNSSLIVGVRQVPEDEIFLSNFDDLDKVKSWDELKTDHPSLDSSKAGWSAMPPSSKLAALSIEPVDKWEEFRYPKIVVALHLQITVENDRQILRAPTLLVLVLDENDRIRGKLYTPLPSPEPSETREEYGVRFWFRLPQNMIERQYRVVAELFGKIEDKPMSPSAYFGMTQTGAWFELDNVYGTLPAWEYSRSYSSYANLYTLLDYQRDDNRIAPPSTISFRNILADTTLVAALIPSLLAGLFYFRKRLVSLAREYPEATTGAAYLTLSLILFLMMIVALVLLR